MFSAYSPMVNRIYTPARSYDEDFMFYEGCIGVSREEYAAKGLLTSAPCLVVPVAARSLQDIMKWTKLLVATLGEQKLEKYQEIYTEYSQQESLPPPPVATEQSTANVIPSTTFAPPPQTEIMQPPFQPAYDAKKDYTERLRQLLRIMNLVEMEDTYVSTQIAGLPQSTTPDDTRFVQPESLQTKPSSSPGASYFSFDQPQLPSLPRQPNSNTPMAYKFLGPAYVIVSNNVEAGDNFVEAYIYFPSMTKDAMPAPNYDFMGRSHRWLWRLFNDSLHATSGQGRCVRMCYGTEPVATKVMRSGYYNITYDTTVAACGCRSTGQDDACGELEVREIKNAGGKTVSKLPPLVNSYTIYRLNHDHPDCATRFAMDSPRQLVLNILPSEWDMFPGCQHAVISNNRQFFMMLHTDGTFGVFTNANGEDVIGMCKNKDTPPLNVPLFSMSFAGMPERVALEDGVLGLYYNDNDGESLVWSQRVAGATAPPPLAIVLLDNGTIDVFDRTNTSVLNPGFTEYQRLQWQAYTEKQAQLSSDQQSGSIQSPYPVNTTLPEYDKIRVASQQVYDPAEDFQRRLEHLREWLKVRNLLFETVSQTFDLSSMAVRMVINGDVGRFEAYDPDENYRLRYNDLMRLLRDNGAI